MVMFRVEFGLHCFNVKFVEAAIVEDQFFVCVAELVKLAALLLVLQAQHAIA